MTVMARPIRSVVSSRETKIYLLTSLQPRFNWACIECAIAGVKLTNAYFSLIFKRHSFLAVCLHNLGQSSPAWRTAFGILFNELNKGRILNLAQWNVAGDHHLSKVLGKLRMAWIARGKKKLFLNSSRPVTELEMLLVSLSVHMLS